MKKLFAIVLSATLLLMGTQAFAQFSVNAGWLNTTEISRVPNTDPSKTNFNGFYAGAMYNIPIVAGLGVQPGLTASMLFYKAADSAGNTTINATISGRYTELALNLPINLTYTLEIGDLDVMGYVGPVIQYGLISNTVGNLGVQVGGIGGNTGDFTTNNFTGVTTDKNGNTSKGDPSRNPFALYIGVGVHMIVSDAIMVSLGYEHSLTNISKVNNEALSRSQIKLGVGYMF